MSRVGFIGLGVMGREMAINLAKAAHDVTVYDVRAEAIDACTAHGAHAARTIAEAAREADVVITMLPDTPQVEAVVLGPGGLLEHPPAGRLLVEMSTISPAATGAMSARLAAEGIAMLDAPVSGGVQSARDARLSVMVGGEKSDFERARTVLQAVGTTIVHVGPSGAGQTVKLCNQLMCALNIQAVCEAFALARAAGLDLNVARDVMMGGAANSWMLEKLGPQIIAKDASAGFRIDLQLKDLRLAGELAFAEGVPLPGMALVTSLYLQARAQGEGGNGNQALFRVYDRLTNQEKS